MIPIGISEILKAVDGTLLWGDENGVVTNVVTDSRKAGKGSLFVPIVGERVDAHRFIPQVMQAGAGVTFSSRKDVAPAASGCCICGTPLQHFKRQRRIIAAGLIFRLSA
ncbi:MAG: Mur ligase domain-containing protein [Eubacterium sp.]